MIPPAYILAGGRSRRFGSDKARHITDQGPQLLVLIDQLRAAGHAVHLVADREDRYADLGWHCLVDAQPDAGPLAGLATALEHRRHACSSSARSLGWLLLVSCDQRQWQASWLSELASHASDAVDACCYVDTLWQPLPGLYHGDLLPPVTERLRQSQFSMHGLLDALGDRVARVRTTQPPSHWSFNTPDEFNRLS